MTGKIALIISKLLTCHWQFVEGSVRRGLPTMLRQAQHDRDRKSTRLNSSHLVISYAVFCLKKKSLPCARVLPAHHLVQRTGPGEISHDRISNLTFPEMDFAVAIARRPQVQNRRRQIESLQQ